MLPGVALAVVLWRRLPRDERRARSASAGPSETKAKSAVDDLEDESHWNAFFLLVVAGTLSGFVYAALMNFLPRYLADMGA